jgi:hypothetical protein
MSIRSGGRIRAGDEEALRVAVDAAPQRREMRNSIATWLAPAEMSRDFLQVPVHVGGIDPGQEIAKFHGQRAAEQPSGFSGASPQLMWMVSAVCGEEIAMSLESRSGIA